MLFARFLKPLIKSGTLVIFDHDGQPGRTRHGREKLTTTSRFAKEIPETLLKRRVHAARDMIEARMDKPKKKPAKRSRKNRRRSRAI